MTELRSQSVNSYTIFILVHFTHSDIDIIAFNHFDLPMLFQSPNDPIGNNRNDDKIK